MHTDALAKGNPFKSSRMLGFCCEQSSKCSKTTANSQRSELTANVPVEIIHLAESLSGNESPTLG